MVNNWFYSTNLYPPINPQQIKEMVQFLREAFPDFAIVFRSIDSQRRHGYFKPLPELGFTLIASRQIYFMQPWETTLLIRGYLKVISNFYRIVDMKSLMEKIFLKWIFLV